MSVPREVLDAAGTGPGDAIVLDQQTPNWCVVINGQPTVLERDQHPNALHVAWRR